MVIYLYFFQYHPLPTTLNETNDQLIILNISDLYDVNNYILWIHKISLLAPIYMHTTSIVDLFITKTQAL